MKNSNNLLLQVKLFWISYMLHVQLFEKSSILRTTGIKQDFYTLEAVDAVIAEYKRLEGDT